MIFDKVLEVFGRRWYFGGKGERYFWLFGGIFRQICRVFGKGSVEIFERWNYIWRGRGDLGVFCIPAVVFPVLVGRWVGWRCEESLVNF